jgi:hypothetical protein
MIKLLDIIEESLLNEDGEEAAKEIDNIAQQVNNIKDKNVQLDLLNKIIDADFNLDKINPNQISEYYDDLKEAASSSLKDGIKAFEPRLIQKIAKALKVKVATVENAVAWVKKIAGFASNVIDKLFFEIARFFRADINNAKIVGRGGLALVSLVVMIFGLISFPTEVAAIGGSLGIIGLAKLALVVIKNISKVKTMWDEIKSAILEHSEYTAVDFLRDIEKKYMETEGSQGKKIPTDWAYELSDWYKNLDKGKQEQASFRMKQLAQFINSGKYQSIRGIVDSYLNKIGNTDSKAIFNTIASYMELMQKGVKVSDQFKQSSDKLEEIARQILSQYNLNRI